MECWVSCKEVRSLKVFCPIFVLLNISQIELSCQYMMTERCQLGDGYRLRASLTCVESAGRHAPAGTGRTPFRCSSVGCLHKSELFRKSHEVQSMLSMMGRLRPVGWIRKAARCNMGCFAVRVGLQLSAFLFDSMHYLSFFFFFLGGCGGGGGQVQTSNC